MENLLQARAAIKAHEIFSKQLQVNWISKESTVERAVREMVKRNIGSMLVCDNELAENKKFVGILTERDYLKKILVKNISSQTAMCGEIMTPRKAITTVTLDSTLYECLQAFETGTFRHLPVVTSRPDLGKGEEEVLAVFSQWDLLQEFKKFHVANLKYMEAFVDFPVW